MNRPRIRPTLIAVERSATLSMENNNETPIAVNKLAIILPIIGIVGLPNVSGVLPMHFIHALPKSTGEYQSAPRIIPIIVATNMPMRLSSNIFAFNNYESTTEPLNSEKIRKNRHPPYK